MMGLLSQSGRALQNYAERNFHRDSSIYLRKSRAFPQIERHSRKNSGLHPTFLPYSALLRFSFQARRIRKPTPAMTATKARNMIIFIARARKPTNPIRTLSNAITSAITTRRLPKIDAAFTIAQNSLVQRYNLTIFPTSGTRPVCKRGIDIVIGFAITRLGQCKTG